jgi:hypothetical protein
MDKVDVSIIKYLGKVQNGIISLITITLKNQNLSFDATFYYTDSQMILTIPEDIEDKIGDIKKIPEYSEILRLCIKKVVPYNQLIDNIDPLDVKPYVEAIFPNIKLD